MKILVVDDEVQLADAIVQILKQHKYEAEAVYDGEDGYHYAMTNLYDVIILDIMMPKMDGITLLKTIRREKISTPVLMLSAKSEIGDKVLGLNVGADDYLTKPFDSSELLARINAISRRKGEFMGDELVFDDLSLDKNAHELCSGGNKIQLSAKEYQIIEMLLKDAGKQLLLESDPSVMTTNHRALRHLLDTINQPEWIGAIFDPGNDIYDPQGETPYPDGFLQIQPYVKHIHIKDAVLTPEGPTCVCIGTGQVDYAGILDALLASGYNGYLSLENHYRKGRTIDEAQMKRPGGADFSDGGAEAAAESMAALQRMLKERRG